MKRKHIIAGTGAAIIGGVIVYFLKRRSNNKAPQLKPAALAKSGEEKIRKIMHHAKEVSNESN